ncbi:hypothetical protein AVEN_271669-1 [Araneus ventricosus]|uniref:Uncharacterized protein n=1 Tax=Araneus ventricosus TaxID=182803 RepID=A0A4Y2MC37_ARAVE|nr:hypothetical protein AVEN_271669-1 [Araneus ventricosus]
MHLNGDLCDSSNTEVGVLTATTGHGPNSSERGTYHHYPRENPNHYCTHVQEREPAYFSDGFSSTYSWCPQMGPRVAGEWGKVGMRI